MRKHILTFATCLVAAGMFSDWAEARLNTVNMSCGEARNIVAARGAVVLSTGSRTYDRFVGYGTYCEYGEYPHPAFVPTRNSSSCFIGYRCKGRRRLDIFDDR